MDENGQVALKAPGMAVPLTLPIAGVVVREFELADLDSVVAQANNRRVSRQLRDRFPYPYEPHHGRAFIEWARQQTPVSVWAIAVDGAAVGGIGLQLGRDIERVSAEIGYWLGEAYWGRGITTAALDAVTMRSFESFGLSRIFALPFATNLPSIRVLEKAGFVREGHLRQAVVKDGAISDVCLYARYRG